MALGELGLTPGEHLGLAAVAGRRNESAAPAQLGIGQVRRARRLHLAHRHVGAERLHHDREGPAGRPQEERRQEVAAHLDARPLRHPERGVHHAVDPHRRPALVHRHRPGVTGRGRSRATPVPLSARRCGAAGRARSSAVSTDVDLRRRRHQGGGRANPPREPASAQPDFDRLGQPHLQRQDDVVRAGVRVHVGQQGLVRDGARRTDVRDALGREIRPHALPVVGKRRGHPLQPVHRGALPRQRGEDRAPRPDPAVLLVGAEQARSCRRGAPGRR